MADHDPTSENELIVSADDGLLDLDEATVEHNISAEFTFETLEQVRARARSLVPVSTMQEK